MITISESPYDVHTTGNPAVWTIMASDADSIPFYWKGVRSELATTGPANLPNGTDLTIAWSEPRFGPTISITFTAVTSPTSDILEIPANPADYASYAAYWQAVADKIQAHPKVFPFLKAYAEDRGVGVSLWLEAMEYDDEWSVTITDPSVASIAVIAHDEIETNFPSNYKVSAEVMVETEFDGTYTRAAILEVIPGTDSKARFNVADVLHAYIRDSLTDPLVPAWDADAPFTTDTVRHYYLRIWEDIGEVSADYDTYLESDPHIAVLGGVASSIAADMDFFGALDVDRPILSWFPDGKTIDEVSPEWLPWYNYKTEDATPGIEWIVYYTDGSTETNTQYLEDIIVAPSEIVLFPISYRLLDVLVFSPLLYKVEIRVVDGSDVSYTAASPWRTYMVDHNYYESVRYLMYLNGFHLPMCLICNGDFEVDLEVDRDTSVAVFAPGATSAFFEQRQHAEDWTNVFTYNTPYLRSLEADALRELLIYGKLYEVSEYGYIPLLLRGKSFRLTTTRNNLNAFSIEAEPALLSRFYSTIMIPTTDEGAAWLTDLENYWATELALPWQLP